jgi:hypothetical protein
LAARLGEIAGKPIELLGRALPETASKAITEATTKALNAALVVALRTMQNEHKAASGVLHKALVATSGARARAADSNGDKAACEQALAEVRNTLGR